MTRPLRIAILTHSTNARGGVVHGLELGAALVRLGHVAVVHAPDPERKGFSHHAEVATQPVAAGRAPRGVTAMVEARIADYVRHFEQAEHRHFDVFHAQDGISGNALATLRERGRIHAFVRTVHHMDAFDDPRLAGLQHRSILQADRILTVSRMWAERIAGEFGAAPVVVGNGVDISRYGPRPTAADAALRARLGLGGGPVFLCVGGVEERKNTLTILDAFGQLRAIQPTAQLLIAGGASVLDHDLYQRAFRARLEAQGLPPSAVVLAGVIPDAEMPALYRLASALVFASLREGFGLVVLEAMASGCPVIVSHIAPFTEYLGDDDVVWCDPHHAGSIANAMASVLAAPLRARLAADGLLAARAHDWQRTARAHLPVYEAIRETADA
jgi:glycosyltransferase-like protein